MIILAAISILFLVSFIIFSLNRLNLKPGYFWFLAVGAGLSAWVLVLISRASGPVYINLMAWESNTLFLASPRLLSDVYSWPFAVAITTLLVAVLLTDIARVPDIGPTSWGFELVLAGSGLLAVLAANPLTLLLAWAIIDLAETYTLLTQVTDSNQRERVVVSFSVRVVGMLLVISAIIRAQIMGVALEFSEIPPEVSGYLILAAGLRLGVFPPHQPCLQEPPLRRGLGTMVRLVPVAASLVLLTRVAAVGASLKWELGLTISSALVLFYGGIAWILSRDELDGRPFWIFGMSSLSVISAVYAQPIACQAWGLGLIFSGGCLFLYSTRDRGYLWLPVLGLVNISAIPFTPVWRGISLFSGWSLLLSIIFSLGFAFLILGYFRHMLRVNESGGEIESWVRLIYPIGLAILLLTHFLVAWSLGWLLPTQMGVLSIEWWLGVLVFSLAAALWYVHQRGYLQIPMDYNALQDVFSFGWLYRILWWMYRSMSLLISHLANLLEGEGGVFWAVLIMILLVTAFVQRGGGG